MERIYAFLESAGTYFLATAQEDQPRVRPFGTIDLFEGRLCFQTGKVKEVSKQMHIDPKVEICAFKDGRWIRIAGEVAVDDRREARKHMLDKYPDLRRMYDEDDGNTEIWYFTGAKAVISSFTQPPVEITI